MSIKDGISAFKDIFTLVKDVFVGVFVAALLLWPSALNQKMKDAGINKADFGVFSWDAQTAEHVSQAKQDIQDGTAALEKYANDPRYAHDEQLKQVLGKFQASEANIASADATMKTAAAEQQKSAQQDTATKQAAVTSGWIMLGRCDQAQKQWVTSNIKVAPGSTYAVAVGQTEELAETVYLRSDSAPGQRASGSIISVVPQGTSVKVLEVDTQSHALAGGWFVWARVTVEKAN